MTNGIYPTYLKLKAGGKRKEKSLSYGHETNTFCQHLQCIYLFKIVRIRASLFLSLSISLSIYMYYTHTHVYMFNCIYILCLHKYTYMCINVGYSAGDQNMAKSLSSGFQMGSRRYFSSSIVKVHLYLQIIWLFFTSQSFPPACSTIVPLLSSE